MKKPKSTVIIGSQWGDEGKGKIVDVLGEKADMIVRYSGGNNAGHTVVLGKEVYKFHLIPSGLIRKKRSLISHGVVLDPKVLLEEIVSIEKRGISTKGVLGIDYRTHIIMPWHVLLDEAREIKKGKAKIGTTIRGIGPCYEDKCSRDGIRFEDLINPKLLEEKINYLYPLKIEMLSGVYGVKFFPTKKSILKEYTQFAKKLQSMATNTTDEIYQFLQKGKRVIFEGAQGVLLDLGSGTYPFVTSSYPGLGGVTIGASIASSLITNVETVVKAYTTRVGSGPFPTELELKPTNPKTLYSIETFKERKEHKTKESYLGEYLRSKGYEFGTTTGRPRRTGWLDLVLINTGHIWNGYTGLHITKLDVLAGLKELKICIAYKLNGKKINTIPASTKGFNQVKPHYITLPGFKDLTDEDWVYIVKEGKKKGFKALPKEAYNYIKRIEKEVKIPILSVSVGPRRDSIIFAK